MSRYVERIREMLSKQYLAHASSKLKLVGINTVPILPGLKRNAGPRAGTTSHFRLPSANNARMRATRAARGGISELLPRRHAALRGATVNLSPRT